MKKNKKKNLIEYIIIHFGWGNQIYVNIDNFKDEAEAIEAYDNNIATPVVIEHDYFKRAYEKALKEAKK